MSLLLREFIYSKIPLDYNSFNSNDPSSGQRFDTMYVVWVEYASTAIIRLIGLMMWSDWCMEEMDFSIFTALVRGVKLFSFWTDV